MHLMSFVVKKLATKRHKEKSTFTRKSKKRHKKNHFAPNHFAKKICTHFVTLQERRRIVVQKIRTYPRFKNLATKMYKKHKEKIILHQIILPKRFVYLEGLRRCKKPAHSAGSTSKAAVTRWLEGTAQAQKAST